MGDGSGVRENRHQLRGAEARERVGGGFAWLAQTRGLAGDAGKGNRQIRGCYSDGCLVAGGAVDHETATALAANDRERADAWMGAAFGAAREVKRQRSVEEAHG